MKMWNSTYESVLLSFIYTFRKPTFIGNIQQRADCPLFTISPFMFLHKWKKSVLVLEQQESE